jgi:hypothetical protein
MSEPAFSPLPNETDHEGNPRRTGVEIEFSDLSEADAANVTARCLNGTARQLDDHDWVVEDSDIGKLDVYLDTALRKGKSSMLKRIGLDAGREVIPVEIVTEPLTLEGLHHADRLRIALKEAGATGSRAGLAYGFGLHLNPAIANTDAKGITYPFIAYAMIEDWMRSADPIDLSRRALPFTDPYPTKLLQAICEAGFVTPDAAADIYLKNAPSRNYGLDMLPIFAWLDEKKVTNALGEENSVSARPAFHFRLPDCRIDEPEWTLRREWDRWRLVEQVAADEGLLTRLMRAWTDDHQGLRTLTRSWSEETGDILAEAGLIPAEKAA